MKINPSPYLSSVKRLAPAASLSSANNDGSISIAGRKYNVNLVTRFWNVRSDQVSIDFDGSQLGVAQEKYNKSQCNAEEVLKAKATALESAAQTPQTFTYNFVDELHPEQVSPEYAAHAAYNESNRSHGLLDPEFMAEQWQSWVQKAAQDDKSGTVGELHEGWEDGRLKYAFVETYGLDAETNVIGTSSFILVQQEGPDGKQNELLLKVADNDRKDRPVTPAITGYAIRSESGEWSCAGNLHPSALEGFKALHLDEAA